MRWLFRRRALFSIMLLVVLNIVAVSVTLTGVQAAQPLTLTGGFSFVVADNIETGESVTDYLLTTDDGMIYNLDLPLDVLGAAGGSLALNNQIVEIAAVGLRDTNRLSVTSLRPIENNTRFDPNPGASGSWIVLMCKFSDVSAQPYNTTQIDTYYNSVPNGAFATIGRIYHGLYTPSISQIYNWVTLPNTQSYYRTYVDNNGFDGLWHLTEHCMTANGLSTSGNYNAQVFVNADWLDGIAVGGWYWNGVGLVRRLSIYPNTVNTATIIHEMGHGNSLPHSSNANNNTNPYDNPWDIMSDGGFFGDDDATVGRLPAPHNSFHMYKTGYIPADDVGTVLSGQRQLFAVDHWGFNTTANRFLVNIPIDNTNADLANYVYAIETRFGVGNNGNNQEHLPSSDGVLIYKHEPETGSRPEPVRLLGAITDDRNNPDYGYDAVMTTGMTYINETDDVVIEVLNRTATGYNVRVQRAYAEGSPRLNISDAGNVTEGGLMTFTATLSATHPSSITVNYALGGTATSGVDYTAPSGSFVIPANTTSTTFSIQTIQDSADEDNEVIGLYISSMSAGDFRKGAAFGRIIDDDAPPTLSITAAPDVLEGNPGDVRALVYTVNLSTASARVVEVRYASYDGSGNSGTEGVDFADTAGTLTFNAGETSKTISVPIIPDIISEPDEWVGMYLYSARNATLNSGSGQNYNFGDILNDDTQLSVNDATATEGANLIFRIQLSTSFNESVTVNYATSNGTAAAGSDYTATSGSVTFSPGQTSREVSVPTIQDGVTESAETVNFTISTTHPTVTIADNAAVGTINNNTALPELDIADAEATEGQPMVFTVSIAHAVASDVMVTYATDDYFAIAGQDYTAASGSVIIPAGQTQTTITVQTIQDTVYEPNNEGFGLEIDTTSVLVDLSSSYASGTILDDDAPPTLTVTGATTVTEGQMINLTLNLSTPTSSSVYIGWDTVGVTASKSTLNELSACSIISYSGDYCHSFFASTWINGGQTTATLQIHTRDDTLTESASETFTLIIEESDKYALAGGQTSFTLTILDNDGLTPPTVTLSGPTSGLEGNVLTYTVALSPAPTNPVTVNFAATDISATSGVDYTVATASPLTFNSGQTSKTITVTSVNDGFVEGDESFTLALTGTSGGILGATTSVTTTLIDTGTFTELVDNGAFDGGSLLPWKVKNKAGTSKNDKIKCNNLNTGKIWALSAPCAFSFEGGTYENTKLTQMLDLTGVTFNPDDTLTFSLALKTNKPPQLTAKLLIVRASATGSMKINLPLGVTGTLYQTFTTAPVTIPGTDITKITVQFIFKGSTSTVKPFIEDVSVRLQ